MGVPSVLQPLLKAAGRPVDLRIYKGGIVDDFDNRRRKLRVGIDISGWIQKVCKRHSDMLASESFLTNQGRHDMMLREKNPPNPETEAEEDSILVQKYVSTCTRSVWERLKVLRDECNLDVLVVFDGASPPIKYNTVKGRLDQNQRYIAIRDNADETLKGDYDESAMELRFKANRRAGAGKHYMTVIAQMIDLLREKQMAFLVSPYEADSQLAFLGNKRPDPTRKEAQQCPLLDMIITEDSDLLVSCECPLVYKLFGQRDQTIPTGILIRRNEDFAAQSIGQLNSLDLLDFSPAMLAVLFVTVGCDYGDTKTSGVGAVTACKYVREAFFPKQQKKENKSALERLFEQLLNRGMKKNQIQKFIDAVIMYRHAVVYDPIEKKCKALGIEEDRGTSQNSERCYGDPELTSYEPYAKTVNDAKGRHMSITGPLFPPTVATYIAEGWLSPKTFRLRKTKSTFDPPSGVLLFLEEYLKPNSQEESRVELHDSSDLIGVSDCSKQSEDRLKSQEELPISRNSNESDHTSTNNMSRKRRRKFN